MYAFDSTLELLLFRKWYMRKRNYWYKTWLVEFFTSDRLRLSSVLLLLLWLYVNGFGRRWLEHMRKYEYAEHGECVHFHYPNFVWWCFALYISHTVWCGQNIRFFSFFWCMQFRSLPNMWNTLSVADDTLLLITPAVLMCAKSRKATK